MGKAKAPRRLADNEARAVLRTIRISPQKLNLVAALIRGMGAYCPRLLVCGFPTKRRVSPLKR